MYKVMLVDDEPLVREFIRKHFANRHPEWEVAQEAMDGQEAWELLERIEVDLVITDIKMPGMNGIELAKRIHGMDNPPQVIILSGFDEFALAQDAIRYNVRNYLLKPVVKDELAEVVQEVTARLERKGQESLALFTQKSISKDSQIQVIKQFLKAVVSESSVEVKTLYPLIYRLKVQLIETEGIIMVLDLDEEVMIKRGIPFGDYAIFRFILQQIAWEMAEEAGHGYVFLDEKQLTCALITGEDRSHILERCKSLYRSVADAVLKNTGITVSGGLGTFESEIFNLQISYANAAHHLQNRLWSDGANLFLQAADNRSIQHFQSMEQTITSVNHALLNRDEPLLSAALRLYLQHLRTFSTAEVMKFGIHLAKGLTGGNNRSLERAYQTLGVAMKQPSSEWTVESVLALYSRMAGCCSSGTDPSLTAPADELDVANRAKSYIYAHYEEPISLALLADKLGVSPGYLSNTFHKTFQETYIKFLTRIRMEQAAKLLKVHPPEKVYDVAEKVGYVSVKHFSYVFKQHYQMPPGEYQELHSPLPAAKRNRQQMER